MTAASPSSPPPTLERLTLVFSLVNEDQRSGCAPFVWVEGCLGGNIEPALRKEDAYFKLIADDGGNNMFTSGGDLFVHPGMSLQVFSFEFDVVRQSDAGFLRKHRAHDTSVYFEYAYGCQDARMKRGKWQLVGAELEDFIEPTARRSDRLRHQPEDYPVAD